jgi:hypothetical protein
MKKTIILAVLLICSVGVACAAQKTRRSADAQLHKSPNGLSPMEARLERESGNSEATSTRIDNARRASRKIKNAIPEAQQGRGRVQHYEVKKNCRGDVTSVKKCPPPAAPQSRK